MIKEIAPFCAVLHKTFAHPVGCGFAHGNEHADDLRQ
jgi:hypothetical protein